MRQNFENMAQCVLTLGKTKIAKILKQWASVHWLVLLGKSDQMLKIVEANKSYKYLKGKS